MSAAGGPLGSALRAVHAKGIVHRDIKPDNVFLIALDGNPISPVLLDFGVANLGTLASGPGTQAGTIIGTPAYMAPEQLLGESVGCAADLFALGVVLYELATGGKFPFQREGEPRPEYLNLTPPALLQRQTQSQPTDPRRHVPTMTDGFAKVLLTALAYHPPDRPTDAAAYLLDLADTYAGSDRKHAVPGASEQGLEAGPAILKRYARDLTTSDAVRETRRALPPAIIASPGVPGIETRFQQIERLGAGGMAEVFLCTVRGAAGFEKPVALKRVLPELAQIPNFAAMFISEARLASKLLHENIIQVTDLQEEPGSGLVLVMEYMDGKDLAGVLERGPLTPSVIIYVMEKALRGLGFAHAYRDEVTHTLGVIHRDVSPHNILIGRNGQVKISDFGLAKAGDASGRARSFVIRGKPAYMSPEQVQGMSLDNRSDLFACGVILWEMLAQRPLFAGTMNETIMRVVHQDIVLPSTLSPGVPKDLEAIAMRLLQRTPSARFQTAEAAVAALQACRDARVNGQDELAHVIQTRFPRPVATPNRPPMVPSADLKQAVTRTAPDMSTTTLGASASQVALGAYPRLKPRIRRRVALARAAVALVVIGAAAITFFATRAVSRHAAPPDAATVALVALGSGRTPDAAIPIAIPDASPVRDAPAASPDAAPIAVVATLPPKSSPPKPSPPKPSPSPGSNVPLSSSRRPAPSAPSGPPGELAVFVQPWATIWVNGKEVGDTPFRQKFPSGHYRVRLTNSDLHRNEDLSITIDADKTTTIQKNWLK